VGAVTAAAALECDRYEWCAVLGCIGLVFTAELFNSSVEVLFRGLEQEARDRVYGCLDIAAGAVLVASLTAAAIGLLIFGRKLLLIGHLVG
ncbi:MAG: diacylglycerol kinase family protein, partial [Gemmata sp.]